MCAVSALSTKRLVVQGAPDGQPRDRPEEKPTKANLNPGRSEARGFLCAAGRARQRRQKRRNKQNLTQARLFRRRDPAREEGVARRRNGRQASWIFRSGVFDGRQIERGLRIENKSPFRVAAAFTLKRSIFEPAHGDRVMGLNCRKAHFVAANEALHRRSPWSMAAAPLHKS
jgi:hypothetical protein